MNDEVKTMSTIDIINEMTYLDRKLIIDELKYNKTVGKDLLRYNLLCSEITRRFPQVKDNDEFKPKKKVLKK